MNRCLWICIIGVFFSASVMAADIDIESLGRPLDDDTKSMYDRYVYFDETEVAQNAPLHLPVLSQTEVGDFAIMATSNALMMSYQDYQERLKDIQSYFTPEGWSDYQDMLEKVQLIKTLSGNYYDLSAALNGIALVGSHGIPGGQEAYEWEVAVPLILTYSRSLGGKVETYPFEMMVRVSVKRVEQGPSWHNVKIDSWKVVQS